MDIVAEFKTQNSAMFPKGSALSLTARSKALNIPVPKNRASSASSAKRTINPSTVSSPQNLFALWQENRGKTFLSVTGAPNKPTASPLPSRERGSSFSFGDSSDSVGRRTGALPVIRSAIETASTQEPLAEAVMQHGLSLMKAQRPAVVQNPAAQVELLVPTETKGDTAVASSSSAASAPRGPSPAPAAEPRSSPLTLPVASYSKPLRKKLRFADPLVHIEPRARSNSDSLTKLPAANNSAAGNNGTTKTAAATIKSILKTSVQWSQPPTQPLQQRPRPYSGGGNSHQNANSPINSTITAIHTMNNTLSNKNIPVVSVMQPTSTSTHTLSLQQQLMQQQQHHQQYSTQLQQPPPVQRPSTASGALGGSYANQGFNPRDSLTSHSSELLRRTMQQAQQLTNSGAADVTDAQQQLSDNFGAPTITSGTSIPASYEDIDPSALRLPVASAASAALFVLPAKSVSLGTLVCASAAPVAFFAEHLSLYCQAPCEAARCITVRYREMSGASLIGLRLRFKVPASLLSSESATVDPSSNLTFVLVDFAASARIQQLRERLLPLIADAQLLSRATSASSSSRQPQNLHLMSQQSAASATGSSLSQALVLR